MKKNQSSLVADTIKESQNMRFRLVLEGLFVGLLAGGLAIFYRVALEEVEAIMRNYLSVAAGNVLYIIGWFILLVILAGLVSYCLKKEPMISGSGIPQVEGEISGYFEQSWFKVIGYKLISGILCILGGLSLGREGPSIQLGAMIGKGISKGFHRFKLEEKYLLTCGASAGLAAAFNAPLAGVMFALEEIHKNFSASVLISVMCASIVGDFISQNVFGLEPVFRFPVESAMPLANYWLLILFGIFIGVLGVGYNYVLLKTQKLYEKVPGLKPHQRVLLPFLLAGVLGFTMPEILGGGHYMIDLLYSDHLVLQVLLVLFLGKFIFSMLSFCSGAPGGIFFPLLVMGAYLGGAFGLVAVNALGLDTALINNFIILAMAGYFTAIVRAPITGIILISEMTGSFQHLLSLSVVCIVSYLTASVFRSVPIYESLLDRLLMKQNIRQVGDTQNKILLEFVVALGSPLSHRKIAQVVWPEHCLLVAIRRGGREVIPKGSVEIMPGDILVALVKEDCAANIRIELLQKCSEGSV